jgi:hypothetical protein
VLKPAGKEIGIPGVSPHWFRRGYATIQHHEGIPDKAIQGQMRHSTPDIPREGYMQPVERE